MKAKIEAFLFVAAEPVSSSEIAVALDETVEDVENMLSILMAEYAQRTDSGLNIVRIAGAYQIMTRPELADDIARFLAGPGNKSRMTKASLETVAIVAYRQPVTLAEVEAIRGVSADRILRSLVERKIVAEAGRKETPGRPILYKTTTQFLQYFGLNDLSQLPRLEDTADDDSVRDAALREVEAAVGNH